MERLNQAAKRARAHKHNQNSARIRTNATVNIAYRLVRKGYVAYVPYDCTRSYIIRDLLQMSVLKTSCFFIYIETYSVKRLGFNVASRSEVLYGGNC